MIFCEHRDGFFWQIVILCIYSAHLSASAKSSVELAQKENLALTDGADKARSASDRPQPGMLCIPGFRVMNNYDIVIKSTKRRPFSFMIES